MWGFFWQLHSSSGASLPLLMSHSWTGEHSSMAADMRGNLICGLSSSTACVPWHSWHTRVIVSAPSASAHVLFYFMFCLSFNAPRRGNKFSAPSLTTFTRHAISLSSFFRIMFKRTNSVILQPLLLTPGFIQIEFHPCLASWQPDMGERFGCHIKLRSYPMHDVHLTSQCKAA